MTIDKMASATAPLSAEVLEALQDLLPEAFVEGVLDPGSLLSALGFAADDVPRFEMLWPSKPVARRDAERPTTATIVPDMDASVSWDTTSNVVIAGDNLQVLKLLQRGYAGAIKLIYIDPPYNTGDSFVYSDDFSVPEVEYLQSTGQADEEGVVTVASVETSGRKHGPWLSMMMPRLVVSRRLLRRDGVIVVAIDDNEMHYLRVLLDGIFGAKNFIGTFVWNGGRKNDAKFISAGHDYMVCYARDIARLRELATRSASDDEDAAWRVRKDGLDAIYAKEAELRSLHGTDFDAMRKDMKAWYKALPEGNPSKDHDHYEFFDERGLFYKGDIASPNPRENLKYEWRGYTTPSNGWRYELARMEALDAEGRISHPETTANLPNVKRYLPKTEYWAPSSVFYTDRRGGSRRLKAMMGDEVFDNPKDPNVLEWLIGASTLADDLIVDFFAGSGTTGQAVWQANASDGGRRRWLLVQEPVPCNETEKTGKKAVEAGFDTIFDITVERLRRASEELHGQLGLDLGFRVFRTRETNLELLPPVLADGATDPDSFVQQSISAALESPVKFGTPDEHVVWEVVTKATALGLDCRVAALEVGERTVYELTSKRRGHPRALICLGELTLEDAEGLELKPDDVLVLRSDKVDDSTTMTLAAQCALLLVERVPNAVSI